MRVLIDICHPAHVHFFRNPIELLCQRGHQVLVTSRDKEMTVQLLNRIGLAHRVLSVAGSGNALGLLGELWARNRALAAEVRRFRPDVMAAIGGIFVAQVGAVIRVPSLVFYDTENARLQNRLTYPFASLVVVPRCYEAWLPKRHRRYAGYHELSYLHPDVFTADRALAVENGLATEGDTFLLRLVAWRANHDIGERGWSIDLLRHLVSKLEAQGRVLISAEGSLPADLADRRYSGNPDVVHHVMAFCRLVIGESATMASESAVLGVPAIYAAHTGRGYTNEQERRFGLVTNISDLSWERLEEAIDAILAVPRVTWAERRRGLLEDTISVTPYVVDCIEEFHGKKPGMA